MTYPPVTTPIPLGPMATDDPENDDDGEICLIGSSGDEDDGGGDGKNTSKPATTTPTTTSELPKPILAAPYTAESLEPGYFQQLDWWESGTDIGEIVKICIGMSLEVKSGCEIKKFDVNESVTAKGQRKKGRIWREQLSKVEAQSQHNFKEWARNMTDAVFEEISALNSTCR
ncbi:hypothetical protein PT974_05298 [Cladobotryum mycophilum]|uniref:Uncharacterized protein n=1 Tax=Cladobotryum mycophilum TaxID=491253 RepID=A0ABR0SJG6_9HYPO